jgi:hypothetical protein
LSTEWVEPQTERASKGPQRAHRGNRAARRLLIVLESTVLAIVVALTAAGPVPPALAGTDNTVAIETLIPYANRDEIRDSTRKDCGLGTKLSRHIVDRSGKRGLTLNRVGNLADSKEARVLGIRITDALGSGGMLPSTSISIDGVLKQDTKVIGTFVATRFSKAGFLPFMTSECSVFSNAVKLLAEDVSKWLEKPSLDARLGDAR